MTMNLVIPDLTVDKFRRNGQVCIPSLAFPASNVIFSARINQTFSSLDSVAQITYDTVTAGAYASVKYGMSLWIGTTAGAKDIGIARIRKAATSAILYIGEESELLLVDNLYLTVVDDFSVWARALRILSNKTTRMDYDIAYSNQHSSKIPIVCLGSHAVVNVQDGAQVVTFDASESSVPNGTPGVTNIPAGGGYYSWACSGGSVSASDRTCDITIDTYGTYLVTCTITYGGATGIGYRKIYAYDDAHPAETDFKITSPPTGSFDTGGWECEIETTSVHFNEVYNRALVILFADDWYYDADGVMNKESFGPLSGRENVIFWGYIDGKTIKGDMNGGTLSFTVKGPQYWVSQITGFIDGVEMTNKTPTSWTKIQNLSVDLALWHFIVWRTTLSLCCDFHFTADTRYMQASKVPVGSLWQQLDTILSTNILGKIRSNRYGMVYTRIDTQYLLSRASVPNLMTAEKSDREPEFTLDIVDNPVTSRVDLSGVNIRPSFKPRAYFSLATGHVFRRYGAPKVVSNLLLLSQVISNRLAGLIMVTDNNKYPRLEINVIENNRYFDICPNQTFIFSLDSQNSPTGITFDKKFIPRTVSLEFSAGYCTVRVSAESLVEEDGLYQNGDVPGSTATPPIKPPRVPRPIPPTIPRVPGRSGGISFMAIMCNGSDGGVFWTRHLATPVWDQMDGGGDPNDYRDMIITRDGTVYVMSNHMVYYAAQNAGPYLSTCFDVAMIAADFGGTLLDIQLVAIGANPVSPDEIFFVISGLAQAYIYKGSGSTFTKLTPVTFHYTDGGWPFSPLGTVSQGIDAILYTGFGFLNRNAWARYDIAGVLQDQGTFDGSFGYWHKRIGTGRELYGVDTSGILFYSPDNGITRESTGFPADFGRGRVDCSPDGTALMGYATGLMNSLVKSQSKFATTTPTTALPSGFNSLALHSHSNKTWVIGGKATDPLLAPNYYPVIYITVDFGVTWTNKTANIMDVLPTTFGTIISIVTL